ncbi:hypothetical protein [Streptomyces chartreusis]
MFDAPVNLGQAGQCGQRSLGEQVRQPYYRDGAGRLRWRTVEDSGVPPSAVAVVLPYEPTALYTRCGHATRWKGFVAHLTETL